MSMFAFFLLRLSVLVELVCSVYDVYFYINVAKVVSDIFPVGYMVYCHRRMFSREVIQYFYEAYDTKQMAHASGPILD